MAQNVDELLKIHSEIIQKLLADLNDDFKEYSENVVDDLKLDDIFILRYVLSTKGDISLIKKQIKLALNWRKEHLPLIKTVKLKEDTVTVTFEGTEEQNKFINFLRTHMCSGILGHTKENNIPVILVRIASTNMRLVLKTVKPEDIVLYQLVKSEGLFRLCDKRTRESRKLISSLCIVDLANFFILSKKFDRKFLSVMTKAKQQSEQLHPKLMLQYMTNIPKGAIILKSIFGRFIKKKDGMKFFSHNDQLLADELVIKNKVADHLPDFLGGSAATSDFFKSFEEKEKVN